MESVATEQEKNVPPCLVVTDAVFYSRESIS